jgi:hypothetical protein
MKNTKSLHNATHTFAKAVSKARRYARILNSEPNSTYAESLFKHYIELANTWSQTDSEKKLVAQTLALAPTQAVDKS